MTIMAIWFMNLEPLTCIYFKMSYIYICDDNYTCVYTRPRLITSKFKCNFCSKLDLYLLL